MRSESCFSTNNFKSHTQGGKNYSISFAGSNWAKLCNLMQLNIWPKKKSLW